MSRKSKKQVKSINNSVTFRLAVSNASESKQIVFGANREALCVDTLHQFPATHGVDAMENTALNYIYTYFIGSQKSDYNKQFLEKLIIPVLMTTVSMTSREEFMRVWNSPNPVLTLMAHDTGDGYHFQAAIGSFNHTDVEFQDDIIKFMIKTINDEKARSAVQDAAEAVIH